MTCNCQRPDQNCEACRADGLAPEAPVVCTVRRGDGAYAASHEYIVTQPDGSETTIWSPPWHNLTEEQEDEGALLAAQAFWEHRDEPEFRFYWHAEEVQP